MRIFILFITTIIITNLSIGQKQGYNDSSNVVVRSFSNAELKEFKNDKEFQYEFPAEASKSLWEKFWDWFWFKIAEIMRTKRGRTTVWTLLIAAGTAAIVFFVIKVTGMSRGGLFSGNGAGDVSYQVEAEDINRISFDEAIKEAISDRNFRMATRLLYLQSLKRLSDKGYIQWHFNKTNSDYIKEVSDRPWQLLFKKLTYNFEYTWYGEVNLANDEFQNLQVQFQQFNNQL